MASWEAGDAWAVPGADGGIDAGYEGERVSWTVSGVAGTGGERAVS
jgi:hypothetical protein